VLVWIDEAWPTAFFSLRQNKKAFYRLLAFCRDLTFSKIKSQQNIEIGHFYRMVLRPFPCVSLQSTHAKQAIHPRHWVARFNRKTIAFSRSQRMVDVTMKGLAKYPEKREQIKHS
jgi:hypothetical protein